MKTHEARVYVLRPLDRSSVAVVIAPDRETAVRALFTSWGLPGASDAEMAIVEVVTSTWADVDDPVVVADVEVLS